MALARLFSLETAADKFTHATHLGRLNEMLRLALNEASITPALVAREFSAFLEREGIEYTTLLHTAQNILACVTPENFTKAKGILDCFKAYGADFSSRHGRFAHEIYTHLHQAIPEASRTPAQREFLAYFDLLSRIPSTADHIRAMISADALAAEAERARATTGARTAAGGAGASAMTTPLRRPALRDISNIHDSPATPRGFKKEYTEVINPDGSIALGQRLVRHPGTATTFGAGHGATGTHASAAPGTNT